PLPGAGPGLRGSTAAAPPSLRSGQPPGSPGEVASLPAGLAGRSTLTNTSRTGVKSADGARPGPANSTEAPPLARELPPKNVPDEPDVVATDDTGAVLTAPPTKPASGPALKPTLVRPTGIAPAPPAARDTGQEPVAEPPAERPAERPSTPGAKRRQRPPLGPKEIEALRRSRIGTGGKEPDPAEQDTTKAPRDRPPRNSQTMETPAKPDAGVDAPF
ncbi:MAG: hypothetical protein HY303_08815, partial [Candidatus Wallbacteria bacterium]|nr:hypothetical protein [Candidatus Wallbacteria bacterium]